MAAIVIKLIDFYTWGIYQDFTDTYNEQLIYPSYILYERRCVTVTT